MANILLEKRVASCPIKPRVGKRVQPSVANRHIEVEVNIVKLNAFCDRDVPKGWYIMYAVKPSHEGSVIGRIYSTWALPQAYESFLEYLSLQGYTIQKGRIECPLLNQ